MYNDDFQFRSDDAKYVGYLRSLEICHYVWGGISAVFGLFPLLYVPFGLWMASGNFPQQPGGPVFPSEIGWFVVVMGVVATLYSETIAILTIISGRKIARREGKLFSMIAAGIICLSFPVGTTLGVFTLIVLAKPEVDRMYHASVKAECND